MSCQKIDRPESEHENKLVKEEFVETGNVTILVPLAIMSRLKVFQRYNYDNTGCFLVKGCLKFWRPCCSVVRDLNSPVTRPQPCSRIIIRSTVILK